MSEPGPGSQLLQGSLCSNPAGGVCALACVEHAQGPPGQVQGDRSGLSVAPCFRAINSPPAETRRQEMRGRSSGPDLLSP